MLHLDSTHEPLPNVTFNLSTSLSQPKTKSLAKKRQHNHPLHSDPIEEPPPSTSLFHPNPKPFPKNRQHNLPLPSDLPTHLSE